MPKPKPDHLHIDITFNCVAGPDVDYLDLKARAEAWLKQVCKTYKMNAVGGFDVYTCKATRETPYAN